jgi:hypothetical protein
MDTWVGGGNKECIQNFGRETFLKTKETGRQHSDGRTDRYSSIETVFSSKLQTQMCSGRHFQFSDLSRKTYIHY